MTDQIGTTFFGVMTISAAGCYIGWNRQGGDGNTWIINQMGGATSGGIHLGESTTGNVYTESAFIAPAGQQSSINGPVKIAGAVGFNGTTPPAKPTITGAKGSNAALASLIAALVSTGLIADSTSA